MKSFVINSNDAGQRVDKFLTKACPSLPQSAMYKAIRTKNIKLNRKRCEISTRLTAGDVLDVYLPDDMLEKGSSIVPDITGEIDVIYEDENIILMDKPRGLVVHEDNEGSRDTLSDRMKAYLRNKGEYDPDSEASFAPSLCNRLDRNTGGIVIGAKNAAALRETDLAIKERRTDKYYICAVAGIMPRKEDILTAYLFKDSSKNMVTVSDKSTPANKEIKTGYRVLKTGISKAGDEYSLLEIRLYTGRTHQIRAHMAHIGHPVIGDGKYGDNRLNRRFSEKKQVLYSYKLRFSFEKGSPLYYLNGKEFSLPPEKTENIGAKW